jgi:periplasmic divalent cation tolerance protein
MGPGFQGVKGEFGVAGPPERRHVKGMQPRDMMVGWTTTATRPDAERLARGLVDERLAACAQVGGPITSVYRWEGAVETAEEFRVTVKFAARQAGAVEDWLARHHPYKTPQWVACAVDAALQKYLKWVVDGSSQ